MKLRNSRVILLALLRETRLVQTCLDMTEASPGDQNLHFHDLY